MRVMQRHAHLDASVLEWEHVLDVLTGAELHVPLRPHLDQELEVAERQRAE